LDGLRTVLQALASLRQASFFVLQVKIWFQNRRAKERKQVKKREEMMQKEKVEAACAAHHQLQQMAAVGGVAM
jgi:uncharacterized protein YdaU (DUF1376 family)